MKLLLLGDIFTEKDHDLLPSSDFIFGNLEGPLGGTTPFPAKRMLNNKRLALKSNPEFIKKLNLSAVSLANNHSWDYGKDGFDITMQYLNDWGWKWAGAGQVSNVQAGDVHLFAYSWHVWPMTASYLLDGEGAVDIQRKRIKEDICSINDDSIKIVSIHWGFEKEILPMPSQRRLAHDMIDWGADIIVGTHPHVIQGIETYKQGLILYSLGNFLFQYANKPSSFPDESIGVRVNSNNFHDYEICVYRGNEKNIKGRIDILSQQLHDKNYEHIWKTKRVRKGLPGRAGSYTYADTFDDF